nr:laminin subunit gamma-1 isoform X1 [Onthophagus taurus]
MFPGLFGLLLGLVSTVFGQFEEVHQTPAIGAEGTRCYDHYGRAQRCIPEFENAAFNLQIEASNTCGDNGPIEYCLQTGTHSRKTCDVCYPNQHDSRFLTDSHTTENQTWWQSETILEGVQYPNQVNLTLHLGKAFDITYVRVWFFSPRPESFAIYKRTTEDDPWIPYQFYSGTCRDTYGLPENLGIARGEETRAFCISEYSDISPLQNGNVLFGTLEKRPSAYNFDTSPELQEWVTATDIKLTLDRLNTFGDEVFGDANVLKSYFYAISDIAVGARCKCNGHASECITSTGIDGSTRRVCKCEHNTAGPDCNECLPFYNDAPWGRASGRNVHECKACNCNGFSHRCYFDKDLYERTGHGGHCLDCVANRDGPNCERCRENYYQREDSYCVACNCDPIGSRSLQCNTEGKCQCKQGVTGDKCDRCDVNHYDFGTHGCRTCGCSEAGSYNNTASCDTRTGTCACKENVEGKRCRECKPGFFNLDIENEFGCTPCFCNGHSSECTNAHGYSKFQMESTFAKNSERWTAEDENKRSTAVQFNALSQNLGVTASGYDAIYFLAPDRFLGDQRASYNQLLKFSLRIGENNPIPKAADITLEGSGSYIRSAIFAQRNPMPSVQTQEYKFRLHQDPKFGWQPKHSARAFVSILTNLTAIKIRGTYTPGGVGFLDNFRLETASRGVAGKPANWVEQCECPEGYVGQFCESCAPGYRHSPSLGGPFMPCIPCDCNKHADICDSETGKCICQDKTAGDNCEICAKGYYGNALGGTRDDCKPCGCPNGGACIQLDEELIMCIECPLGYTGHRCESCADGYFGDPLGKYGPPSECQQCDCNFNIDLNAIGNCNTTTGECLKCVHNTGGPRCDKCLSGFFGDALKLPKGDCQQCECYALATLEGPDGIPICDQFSGTCSCKNHVQGRNCDRCEIGYFNINSGEGCESCNCDPVGSINNTCNLYNGQCNCKPGITGLRCNQCEIYKYGFSSEGCKSCDCDPIGSKEPQCNPLGQCPCFDNVEGKRCDRCKENKHDRQRGCIDCPDCYNLVRDEAHAHQKKIEHLRTIIDDIEGSPTVVFDDQFEKKLKELKAEVERYYQLAKDGTGGDGDKTISEKLNDIRERQKEISRVLSQIDESIYLAKDKGLKALENVTETDNILKLAGDDLQNAFQILDIKGKAALEDAQQRAKEYGETSDLMTLISQEARNIADQLEFEANDITNQALDADKQSTEAYDLASQLSSQRNNISEQLTNLKNDISRTEEKLKRTQNATLDAHKSAQEAKDKALALLAEVTNLDVPNEDIYKLKNRSEEARKLAAQLLKESDDLIAQNEDLLKEIAEQILNVDDLIEKGIQQNDDINQIMNDINMLEAQADKAVELGDNTLNRANATYESLKHFDQQVRKSKADADQQLALIPKIRQLITETINETAQTQSDLINAKLDAEAALNRVESASDESTSAVKNMEDIKTEVDQRFKNATHFQTEAELMENRVAMVKSEFDELAKQSGKNGTLLNEVKEKVGRAGKDTADASKKVNDILKDVQGIMKELDNLPSFDDAELDRLEEQLRLAEQKFQDANLEAILEKLQREQTEQDSLVEAYTLEIKKLKKEVENVEQIANTIPNGCFKQVHLEP